MRVSIRLSRKIGKDGTVRDALSDRERATGGRQDELDRAIVPRYGAELYSFFGLLHYSRVQGFDSIAAIQPAEVEAMARLLNITLSPWEVETLFVLDAAVRDELRKQSPEGAQ